MKNKKKKPVFVLTCVVQTTRVLRRGDIIDKRVKISDRVTLHKSPSKKILILNNYVYIFVIFFFFLI